MRFSILHHIKYRRIRREFSFGRFVEPIFLRASQILLIPDLYLELIEDVGYYTPRFLVAFARKDEDHKNTLILFLARMKPLIAIEKGR